MKKINYSLILPCFNESEHLIDSVQIIFSTLRNFNSYPEIIFIEDKSSDNTKYLLEKIRLEYRKFFDIRLIFHQKNLGRGASVAEGIKKARTDIVGFMDIDCEINPHYIPIFVKEIENGYAIVTAWRIYNFSLVSIHRWLISKIYARIINRLFDIGLHDTEAGFKFFSKGKIEPILSQVKNKHWFWDSEILIRSKIAELSIKEVPTVFIKRKDKTSTVRIIPDTIDYIKNIINLKKN